MRYLGKKMTFNVSMRTCVSPTNRPSPGSLAALCRPPLPEGAQPPDPRSMVPLQKYDKIQNLKLVVCMGEEGSFGGRFNVLLLKIDRKCVDEGV